MPATLVPNSEIPAMAQRVTPDHRAVLAEIQRVGFIRNQELDAGTVAALEELTKLGLVDAAYDDSRNGPVYLWTSNGNGQRVLRYLTGLRSGPHYEVAAEDLAAWLEAQGDDRWWSVDGDPILAGRLDFPCPADELAAELRKIGKPLLIQARKEDVAARGEKLTRERLDEVAGKIADNLRTIRGGELPAWSSDRLLYLCWKGSTNDWLLSEEREAARQMQASDIGNAANVADMKKE